MAAKNTVGVVATVVTVLATAAAAVLALWCTVVAFRGGRMPLLGIRTDGSIWLGILWLLVITPAVIGFAFYAVRPLIEAVLSPFTAGRD